MDKPRKIIEKRIEEEAERLFGNDETLKQIHKLNALQEMGFIDEKEIEEYVEELKQVHECERKMYEETFTMTLDKNGNVVNIMDLEN